jgi:hypothetical protein
MTMLLSLLLLLAKAQKAPEADTRSGLEPVQRALYERVQQVSRASVGHLMGVGETCRAYHLKGIGAFFVLAPRALPLRSGPGVLVLQPPPLPLLPPEELEARQKIRNQRVRDLETVKGQNEAEIRALEEQVREFQKEARRAHQEADRMVEEQFALVRKARELGNPIPPPPVDVVEPPSPPWESWFIEEEHLDSRSADKVVSDVQAAVTQALEQSVRQLDVVAPDEWVIVAVDFFPQRLFFAPPSGPVKTVVIRARKKDLVEGASGKITPEELQKRIEFTQY